MYSLLIDFFYANNAIVMYSVYSHNLKANFLDYFIMWMSRHLNNSLTTFQKISCRIKSELINYLKKSIWLNLRDYFLFPNVHNVWKTWTINIQIYFLWDIIRHSKPHVQNLSRSVSWTVQASMLKSQMLKLIFSTLSQKKKHFSFCMVW